MELVYGILTTVTGAVFWGLVFWERRKTYPDGQIHWDIEPSGKDRWPAFAYLLIGAALMGISGSLHYTALGLTSIFLGLCTMLPYSLLLIWHNRRLKPQAGSYK